MIVLRAFYVFPSFSILLLYCRVVLVEAGDKVLGTFDSSLSSYVERTLTSRSVDLRTNCAIEEVRLYFLTDGYEITLSSIFIYEDRYAAKGVPFMYPDCIRMHSLDSKYCKRPSLFYWSLMSSLQKSLYFR